MASSTVVPVSEYLRTSYDPDCDYVDGEIEERNLGELDHSDLQMRLAMLLSAQKNSAHIRVNPELRVQVTTTRFRVPDICVRSRHAPREQIVVSAPLLCIEILSPEDTVQRMQERVRDYLDMGVPEVWVVNPKSRSVMIYADSTMVERDGGEIAVPETPVRLAIVDIFKVLDEY